VEQRDQDGTLKGDGGQTRNVLERPPSSYNSSTRLNSAR
jgi:hypothetical protein